MSRDFLATELAVSLVSMSVMTRNIFFVQLTGQCIPETDTDFHSKNRTMIQTVRPGIWIRRPRQTLRELQSVEVMIVPWQTFSFRPSSSDERRPKENTCLHRYHRYLGSPDLTVVLSSRLGCPRKCQREICASWLPTCYRARQKDCMQLCTM